MSSPTQGVWECRHGVDSRDHCEECFPVTACCMSCGEAMWWIDCPTGGWWKHVVHPVDGHDGEAPLPAQYLDGKVT